MYVLYADICSWNAYFILKLLKNSGGLIVSYKESKNIFTFSAKNSV